MSAIACAPPPSPPPPPPNNLPEWATKISVNQSKLEKALKRQKTAHGRLYACFFKVHFISFCLLLGKVLKLRLFKPKTNSKPVKNVLIMKMVLLEILKWLAMYYWILIRHILNAIYNKAGFLSLARSFFSVCLVGATLVDSVQILAIQEQNKNVVEAHRKTQYDLECKVQKQHCCIEYSTAFTQASITLHVWLICSLGCSVLLSFFNCNFQALHQAPMKNKMNWQTIWNNLLHVLFLEQCPSYSYIVLLVKEVIQPNHQVFQGAQASRSLVTIPATASLPCFNYY